jgi:hypothetical protein
LALALPSGAKAPFFSDRCGTAEAVPLSKTSKAQTLKHQKLKISKA